MSLPSDLVRQRPDILASEAQLHGASANIGVATAAFPHGNQDPSTRTDYTLAGVAVIFLAVVGALTNRELGEPAPQLDCPEVPRSMHAMFVADRGRYAELVVARPDLSACLR